jgi:hypothetical protein
LSGVSGLEKCVADVNTTCCGLKENNVLLFVVSCQAVFGAWSGTPVLAPPQSASPFSRSNQLTVRTFDGASNVETAAVAEEDFLFAGRPNRWASPSRNLAKNACCLKILAKFAALEKSAGAF